MKKEKEVKMPEREYIVALTSDEWLYIIEHLKEWEYLRKKIFEYLVSD